VGSLKASRSPSSDMLFRQYKDMKVWSRAGPSQQCTTKEILAKLFETGTSDSGGGVEVDILKESLFR
jgi:hypothetical protein